MQLYQAFQNYRFSAFAYCAAVTIGILPLCPASAQEEEYPSNAEMHPGQIVYSRVVPYGTATRRFAQGEARTVSPDQSVLITNSLLVGLEPLSDAEQAGVTAPLNQGLGTTGSALQVGLSALGSSQASNGDFTRAESGSNSVGGVIGNSMNAMNSSLGVIGKVLGDGQ